MTTVPALPRIELDNVCVVIPVLSDAVPLKYLLRDLRAGSFAQIVVSCGDDSEYDFLDEGEITFIRTRKGRGQQIAAATTRTNTEWIWILHADIRVSREAMLALRDALTHAQWGAFRIKLAGSARFLSIIGFMINWRSRLSSIYTGDQGMFIRRELIQRTGGFPPIPLMEDIECSRRLRRMHRGTQLRELLSVSARKWEREGVLRTIFRMWRCRFLYFFGATPERLANRYYL